MKLSKSKIFYIFLTVYFLMFSLLQFLRHVPGVDAMEAILWGELLDFGTNKHPPLSGYIMSGFYHLFGQNINITYFLSTACIVTGLIFVYKLAKFFLSKEKAICASIIMTACFYYTNTLFVETFNCNFVAIAIFPMIAYFYYKSVRKNNIMDWILFGTTSALGILNKYQAIFIFIPLFIHLVIFERKQFKQKGLYISIFCGLALLLPHIIWLIKHDFFSFTYMISQAEKDVSCSTISLLFSRIFNPIKFTVDQILATSGCIGAYLLLAYQAKNIKINSDKNNISDKAFVLLLALGIVLSQAFMAVITGSHIPGVWGSIMVGFTGIALFYFFPINFNEKSFSFFVTLSYIIITIWFISLVIFNFVQTSTRICYPYETTMPYFHTKWNERTNNAPLKYVGGNSRYIYAFRFYDKTKPHVILESFGYKNPWENHDDILKSGALITAKSKKDLIKMVKETIIELPDDYKIVPEKYKYNITNKFGKSKKVTVHYAIIPPMDNN